MDSSFTFFPYRPQKYGSILFYIVAFASFLCASLTYITGWVKVLFLIYGFLSLYLAWSMRCLAFLCVNISPEGITLKNNNDSFHSSWKSFVAVYSMSDLKGHSYLLFAKRRMNKKKQKAVVSKMLRIKGGQPALNVDGNVYIKVDEHREKIIALARGQGMIVEDDT